MNCSLCQKELENYLQGKLPEGFRIQVESHLNECKSCAENAAMLNVFNEMIQKEKDRGSNPFLSTRVMAAIETLEHQKAPTPVFTRIMRPIVIGVSISAAVFLGIFAGNFYNAGQSQNSIPEELSLIDDVSLEYVDTYTN